MMRTITAALGFLIAVCCARSAAQEGAPPNLVVFLVDDMGWQDTSVPFHTEPTPLNRRYHTPHMERLAAQGMKFTQAYAHAICSPTRVSMMTGLHAARHRVTNWTLRFDGSNDRPHRSLDPAPWNVNGLSPVPGIAHTVHARSLPSWLGEVGYRTIHVGKAHFGAIDTPAADPLAIGFDVNVAGHAAGGPGSFYAADHFSATRRAKNPSNDRVWDVPGLERYHGTSLYLTEALTREAVRILEETVAAGQPFFLHLSHYAVHAPIMADPRFVHRYPELDPTEAAYASMVEGMDESLGDVLDTLQALGVDDRTVVLFVSDNGGLSHVARGGERLTHNAPLSCGKGSAREGGIRVPMLAAWPGVIPGGTACDVPVIVEDFLPTLAEIAGVETTDQTGEQDGGALDGLSLVPLFRDPAARPAAFDRALVWHQPNHWSIDSHPGYGPHSSIRVGDLKFIHYHAPDHAPRFELFDLAHDLGETENLIDERPDLAQQLADLLQGRLIDLGADRMTVRETGELVAWPGDALRAARG